MDLDDARGFVMADYPGEGLLKARQTAPALDTGLAHIERTKLLIHVVDAAGSEEEDIEDIKAINKSFPPMSRRSAIKKAGSRGQQVC